MVWAAALALALQANPFDKFDPPWVLPWPENMAWGRLTSDGEQFWVVKGEFKVTTPSASQKFVTLWMHGRHRGNADVKHRSSVWRFQFDCNGNVTTLAFDTYDAAGKRLQTWDGYSRASAIRPSSIYEDMERQFCALPAG